MSENEPTDADDTVDADDDATAPAGDDTNTSADTNAEAETEGKDTREGAGVDEVADGDVIRIAYTARTVEDGTVVDTTDAETAQEAGAEDGDFGPRVIVVGGGHLFDAVDADLVGRTVDETATVTVPAAEAFGEYDQDEVRTVSADRIDEDDRYPGADVTIDGERGYVETVVGGRARVDFNHPLAGEDIEYEYEVLERIDDPLEIARGLMQTFVDADLEMRIEVDESEEERPVEDEDEDTAEADDVDGGDGADAEAAADEDDDEDIDVPGPEFETVTVERESLIVEVTPQMSFNQQWLFQKRQIAQQIMQHAEVDRVVFQEIIDGSGMGMGMGGMMGGLGGAGGAGGGGDVEAALSDADVDAEDLVEEIEATDE